jgi:hypothetical protein
MKDIKKYNQADGYEEKAIVRKNASVSSIVPTLRRGNSVCNAPALRDAGASDTAFPFMPQRVRRSVGTINMRHRALLTISLAVLSGCSAWSSNPARTQADYGASVRNMVSNQIYNPDKAQNPDALLPDGMDVDKTGAVLNKTYRGLVFTPREDLRHITTYGQPNISILGGSGGGAR